MERVQSFIPQQAQALRSFAYRINLIFLTHQSVISVRTSTTLCLKIFMITLKTRLISTLIHLLKMLNSRTAMIRKVILLTQPMKIMSAKSALFQSAEAAASGWNMFVITLTFPQSRIVLTSVFVWSSLPQSFHTSQTNSTKVRLFTAQNSSRTMCVHSA